MSSHLSKTGCRSRQSTVNQQLPIQTYRHNNKWFTALCLLVCYASEDFLVVSTQSSLRNILFIFLYATSSCLYRLHTFLLHFWRFAWCMVFGHFYYRCLHKSTLSSRETPIMRCDSLDFIFVLVVLVLFVLLKNIMKLDWILTFWQCIIQTYVYIAVYFWWRSYTKKKKKKKNWKIKLFSS